MGITKAKGCVSMLILVGNDCIWSVVVDLRNDLCIWQIRWLQEFLEHLTR
jgi:hypothetical protein